MNPTNALDALTAEFAKKERKTIKVEGLPDPLYSLPMNLEDNMSLLDIHETKDPEKRAKAMCGFLVAKVEAEDGSRAFKNCNNKPAAEVLRTQVDPEIVLEIFSQVASGSEAKEVEDLEGKSDEPDTE